MNARAWLTAARPLAHANIAPPIVLGLALGHADGASPSALAVTVGLAFGVLDHLVIVFSNDYGDREADAHLGGKTLFSGGSRVIQDGALSPGALRGAAVGAAVSLAMLCIGGALLLDRPLLPAFGLVALALAHAYTFGPLRLAYRGAGALAQGLGVGVVLPCLGCYLATGRLAVPLAAAPLFALGVASNVLTALPDVHGDRAAGKRTWPVVRGERVARRDALGLVGIGLLLALAISPSLPWWVLAPPALALLLAAALGRGADAIRRAACVRFVFFAAGAIPMLQILWAARLAGA